MLSKIPETMQEFINSDFIKFIYAFGIGQAVLLAILLIRKKINIHSNRFLAAVFMLSAIELISGLFYLGEYFKDYPGFIGLSNGLAYLFGPLMYFYIYFLKPENKEKLSKAYIHFIPFVIAYLFYTIPVLGTDTTEKLSFVQQQFSFNTPTSILGFLAPVHSLSYICFSLVKIHKIVRSIEYNFSNVEFANLYWLKYFFYGVLFQALTVLVMHLFESSVQFDIKYIMLLSVAVFMIVSGYVSLKQPEVKSLIVKPDNIPPAKKEYKKAALKDEQIDELISRLKNILENEKLYLNPKLSLKDLSDKTDISTHNLTELINTQLDKSFYELINFYRIEEVKRLISEDSEKKFSLLALAYEAGFSSKTSFNTIFKKFVSKTPSEYRNEILNRL